MDEFKIVDALTGTTVMQDASTGELFTKKSNSNTNKCTSLFFPGCSMINYAMPLVSEVYNTLFTRDEADGVSLLCCGKILSYEQGGDALRLEFESQLRNHLVDSGIKRIICACPNCMLALRQSLVCDERTKDITLKTLPELLVEMGYTVDVQAISQVVKGESSASALLCPHDSCPDRNYGEYARGLRDILPQGSWVDPAHSRSNSICCGSLPRAAGKIEAADKCADINGQEALAVSADAIVTPCFSCAFQLNVAQNHLRAIHYLELLYKRPVDWSSVSMWMKVRFLFDDIMGATELDEVDGRKYSALDAQAATDVSISNANTEEINL